MKFKEIKLTKNLANRTLALLLSACMIGTSFGSVPLTAYASQGTDGLCEHHTAHDSSCGYSEAGQGCECTHTHDDSCGYSEGSACNHTHTEKCGENGADCTHTHNGDCGYQEASPCNHTHNGDCEYSEGSGGSPCTYTCEICNNTNGGNNGEGRNNDDPADDPVDEPEVDGDEEDDDPAENENTAVRYIVTAWEWIDEEENLDPESGALVLSAEEETPCMFEDVAELLPMQIRTEVFAYKAEDEKDTNTGNSNTESEVDTETPPLTLENITSMDLDVADWVCEEYPEEGAYKGSYTFTASLPEGYELSEDAEALTIIVMFTNVSLLASSFDTTVCTDYGRAVQLGVSGISNPVRHDTVGTYSILLSNGKVVASDLVNVRYFLPSDYIYLGMYGDVPIKWRVLDADKANDKKTDGFFLLSEHVLYEDEVPYYAKKPLTHEWEYSDARKWCINYAKDEKTFSKTEQELLFGVNKTEEWEDFPNSLGEGSKNTLNGEEKIFWLSERELMDYIADLGHLPGIMATSIMDPNSSSGKSYWLRTPTGTNDETAQYVYYPGSVMAKYVTNKYGVRPATNIRKDSILFLSSEDVKDELGLFQVANASMPEWRMTILDSSRAFRVTTNSASGKIGDTVSLSYNGAVTGTNEYISAMIMSGEEVEYYGRLGSAYTSSGNISFIIPDLPIGTYTVKLFNEQYNGQKKTGLSSSFEEVNLTVEGSSICYHPGKDGSGRLLGVPRTGDGSVALMGAIYTRPLFKQIGWSTTENGDKEYELGGTYTKPGTVTLYPVWERCGDKITFNLNGGKIPTYSAGNSVYYPKEKYPETYLYGGMELPCPVYENKKFVGWSGSIGYVNYERIMEIPPDAKGEAELIAQWEDNKFKIIYRYAPDADVDFTNCDCAYIGGVKTPLPSAYIGGVETPLPSVYSKKYGLNCYWSGKIGDKNYYLIRSIPATATGEADLTAQFGQYIFTYRPGSNGTGEVVMDAMGAGVKNLRNALYVNEGYEQLGWSTTDGGKKEYELGQEFTDFSGDLTLYPVWGKKQKIVYELVGGTINGEYPTSYVEGGETLLPTDVTRAGYVFGGWYIKSSKLEKIGPEMTGDIEVRAKWRRICKIRYSLDGGTINGEYPTSYIEGEETLLPKNVTLKDYVFDGWYMNGSKIEKISSEMSGDIRVDARWKKYYNVTIIQTEGGTAKTTPKKAIEGTEITLTAEPNEGYRLVSWLSTPSDLIIQDNKFTMPSAKVTITPKFELIPYEVKFDANGGVGEMESQIYYWGVEQCLKANVYNREGYVFAGWNTKEDGTGIGYTDVEEIVLKEKLTLYAQWREELPERYTIKYVPGTGAEGTTAACSKIKGTALMLEGELFKRSGYRQIGWTTVEEGDIEYGLGAVFTENRDVTLYPAWENGVYEITYKLIRGDQIEGEYPNTYTYGEGVVLPTEVTRKGYQFLGWKTEDNVSVTTITPKEWGNKTFYPMWQAVQHKLWFDRTDGIGEMMEAQMFERDVPQKLSKNTYQREGYVFAGWTPDKLPSKDSPIYEDEQEYVFPSSMYELMFYARWVEQSSAVTITFDANGGTGQMEPQMRAKDVFWSLPRNTFKREGYVFRGWSFQKDKYVYAYDDCAREKIESSVTLYAWWEQATEVTFDANGGTGEMESQMIGSGEWTLQKNTFQKAGYLFAGWNTERDGSGSYYTDEGEISASQGVKLYAQWYEVNRKPVISGTYGQNLSKMNLTPGKIMYRNEVLEGTWILTDRNKTDVPIVGETTAYEVTFTPLDKPEWTLVMQVVPEVAKRTIAVTVDNKTKKYGRWNPELTYTVPDGALVDGDTEKDLGITLSCTAGRLAPVSQSGYPITGTAVSANYDVKLTTGVLTIEKTNAAITVNQYAYAKTKVDAPFMLDVEGVHNESALQYKVTKGTDIVSVKNGVVTLLKEGTAEITVFQPEGINYLATDSRIITISVEKGTSVLTLDSTSYTKTFGDGAFALGVNCSHSESLLTYVVSNSKTFDGVDVENSAIITVDANGKATIQGAGTATVTVSQAESDNYLAAIPKTITITVNKAAYPSNKPSATMSVANSCKTVGAVELPRDWEWDTGEAEKTLTVGKPLTVTAVYNGADKDNYETEGLETSVAIIRKAAEKLGSSGGNISGNGGTDNSTVVALQPMPIIPQPTLPVTQSPLPKPILPEDDADDPNKAPIIKGENGKEGWENIRTETEGTPEGSTVTVDMNGTVVVPSEVLSDIRGRDVTLAFDMGNGITWSVNGLDITGEVGDIDFGVAMGAQAGRSIPVEVLNNVTGERTSLNLTLAYEGEFGFTAVLTVNMQAENAGLYANLFYYNPSTGELEFICSDLIREDGTTDLTFTHASDYTIVIDSVPMDGSVKVTDDAGNTDGSTNGSGEAENTDSIATTDAEPTWNPLWIILIGAVVIVVGLGRFVIAKKKREEE